MLTRSGRKRELGRYSDVGIQLRPRLGPLRRSFFLSADGWFAGGADDFDDFLPHESASLSHIDEVHVVAGFVDLGCHFEDVERAVAFCRSDRLDFDGFRPVRYSKPCLLRFREMPRKGAMCGPTR